MDSLPSWNEAEGLRIRKTCPGCSQGPHQAPGAWTTRVLMRMSLPGRRPSGPPGPLEQFSILNAARGVHQLFLWVGKCMEPSLPGSRKRFGRVLKKTAYRASHRAVGRVLGVGVGVALPAAGFDQRGGRCCVLSRGHMSMDTLHGYRPAALHTAPHFPLI